MAMNSPYIPQEEWSGSAYQKGSPYYNQNAMGNAGFFIPNSNQSYTGNAINNAQSFTPQFAGGGQGFYANNQSQINPQQANQVYPQSFLMGQQYSQQQEGIGAAIERLMPLLSKMGIPTSPADVSKQIEQQTAIESYPIQQSLREAEREIGEDASRRGASLGSDRERLLGEVRGSAAGALRQKEVGAPLEYAIKMLQSLPGLMGSLR